MVAELATLIFTRRTGGRYVLSVLDVFTKTGQGYCPDFRQ